MKKLAMAPTQLRERFLRLIERERRRAEEGQAAEIRAKMNSLVDEEIIHALYAASRAGVKIRLNVRGICCLRPGVKGASETIEVVSIVDRFLEHARIFYFRNGGDEEVYLASADWMARNLDRRVELLFPVEAEAAKAKVLAALDTLFQDNVKGAPARRRRDLEAAAARPGRRALPRPDRDLSRGPARPGPRPGPPRREPRADHRARRASERGGRHSETRPRSPPFAKRSARPWPAGRGRVQRRLLLRVSRHPRRRLVGNPRPGARLLPGPHPDLGGLLPLAEWQRPRARPRCCDAASPGSPATGPSYCGLDLARLRVEAEGCRERVLSGEAFPEGPESLPRYRLQ